MHTTLYIRCCDSISSCNCFFFSSRRRHTRWPRDWSSDVCSSDLDDIRAMQVPDPALQAMEDRFRSALGERTALQYLLVDAASRQELLEQRSEERRVGKECR